MLARDKQGVTPLACLLLQHMPVHLQALTQTLASNCVQTNPTTGRAITCE